MPFSKCLRAKIYSNMNVYFDPQGCQTLLLKESDPLLFSLGSWTINEQHDFRRNLTSDVIVTLTLDVGTQLLCATHLIICSIFL